MSTQRTFPNWLDAFLEYSDDNFTPPQFDEWAGINAIAGALQRKVWLPWSDTLNYYPNLFILLVSLPGAGKTTAINKTVGLLQEMNSRSGTMHFIPSQITEAEFIEQMSTQTSFNVGTVVRTQSAGYYFASEASNSLKNVYGDFLACLTDFYDNPNFWEKSTRKDGRKTLKNVNLNLIAGSTFDYLSKLVSDENIMGGFASRIIYVLSSGKEIKPQKFQAGIKDAETKQLRVDFRKELVADLRRIHTLAGEFAPTPEFARTWEDWHYKFETRRAAEPSEKLQSLLVRTNTNLIKVCMCLSAAESNDLLLKAHHFERAWKMLEPIVTEIPAIFRSSKALDVHSQSGLNNAIIKGAEAAGGQISEHDLKSTLLGRGFSGARVRETVDYMIKVGDLKVVAVSSAGQTYEFVGDLNRYL